MRQEEKSVLLELFKYGDVEIKVIEKDEMCETTAQMYIRIR